MWDAQTGTELLTLTGHDGVVLSAAYSTDGPRIVTASSDNTAKVWEAQTGAELLTLTVMMVGLSQRPTVQMVSELPPPV